MSKRKHTEHTDDLTEDATEETTGAQGPGADEGERHAAQGGSPEVEEATAESTAESAAGATAGAIEESDRTTEGSVEEKVPSPLQAARTEAGRYRRELREAQAQRDQLRSELEAMRWGEVQRAFRGLRSTDPVRAAGYTIDDFAGEDGVIDPEKVRQVEAEYAESMGLALRTEQDQRALEAAMGAMDAGKRGSHVGAGPSWSNALQRGR